MPIFKLQNPILNYPWGSKTVLAKLMGKKNTSQMPQAELWMGSHPKAPSLIQLKQKSVPLDNAIAQFPVHFLGKKVAKRYSNELPFLFKVLAIDNPLSIQAHPNAIQAKKGFRIENERQIPINAPERNYKDTWAKPEMICAYTELRALYGFRKPSEILKNLSPIKSSLLASIKDHLKKERPAKALKYLFVHLMTLELKAKHQVISEAIRVARKLHKTNELFDWVLYLNHHFPGDIGILAPLFLNMVYLKPGQAIFLAPGILHSYLEGTGIELMGNSDNVLRGGLTQKHIDVKELSKILKFKSITPTRLKIRKTGPSNSAENSFVTPTRDFCLSYIHLHKQETYKRQGMLPEILLCTRGHAAISLPESKQKIKVRRGDSFFIPAHSEKYHIEGKAFIYKASVGVF